MALVGTTGVRGPRGHLLSWFAFLGPRHT